jgi:hypothetical protein
MHCKTREKQPKMLTIDVLCIGIEVTGLFSCLFFLHFLMFSILVMFYFIVGKFVNQKSKDKNFQVPFVLTEIYCTVKIVTKFSCC